MLRIGGVPEHFNEPWLSAIEEDATVSWRSFPGGTGAMCEALSKREIDCALLLTEGAVKHCMEKKDTILYGVYVRSPLVWGVHCGAKSAFVDLKSITEEEEVTFAISRFGSGSHLMAFVLAKQMRWKHLKFQLVGTLKGAKEYLENDNPNALFMWEKAMTDPLVRQGSLKRLGECPTPWPCFVLAVRKTGVVADLSKVDSIVSKVKQKCLEFKLDREATVERVVNKFGIKQDLVEEWFDRLEFACDRGLDLQMVESVKSTLIEIGQLAESFRPLDVREICVEMSSSSNL